MNSSLHNHFEDQYDTANNIRTMLCEYASVGQINVALTGHGKFTAFADIQDVLKELKNDAEKYIQNNEPQNISEDAEIDLFTVAEFYEEYKKFPSDNPIAVTKFCQNLLNLNIIPGCEVYFGEDDTTGNTRNHMILIAKDNEGFRQLSNILSDSERLAPNTYRNYPIVTKDILRKNIKDGHLICTSACVGGVFSPYLGLKAKNIKDEINKLTKKVEEAEKYVEERFSRRDEYITVIKEYTKPLKKDLNAKISFARHNSTSIEDFNLIKKQLEDEFQIADDLYKENLPLIKKAKEELPKIEKEIQKYNELKVKIQELLIQYKEYSIPDFDKASELYYDLESIFGKENFFFELQGHGLEIEDIVYSNLIELAFRINNSQFVVSNDVHMGVRKSNPEYKKYINLRSISKFRRFNSYEKDTRDEFEYCIKTEEELVESICDTISNSKIKDIINDAVKRTDELLASCKYSLDKEKYYPAVEDADKKLLEAIRKGTLEKFPEGLPEEYKDRINYEYKIIKKMGYSAYHLIVKDYLEYGRLLGYLSEDEIEKAPLTIEELEDYLNKTNNPRIGQGIGPGRGSAAGSVVCWVLGITNLDPIKYGLLFERFLNPERVSMPDIDSDFSPIIRDKVILYCENKYGKENVCKIMNKSYGAPAGNIRLAGRYLSGKKLSEFEKFSFDEVVQNPELINPQIDIDKQYVRYSDKLAKMYQVLEKIRKKELGITGSELPLSEIISIFNSIKKENNLNSDEIEILNTALDAQAIFTGYGQHASGVCIASKPISDIYPLMYNSKKNNFSIQCDMVQTEERGIIKMDFLGLNNLKIISDIVARPTNPEDIDPILQTFAGLNTVIEDKSIYEDIFSQGLTQGIFQFESPGMKSMNKTFKPKSFEDIILLVSLYRPGALKYVDEIIAQKWYREDPEKYLKEHNGIIPKKTIDFNCPALDEILKPTYGCPVYQEQVMQIFQKIGGYSLGGADMVRRYMSKKKVDKLLHERDAFIYGDPSRNIEGCIKLHGFTPEEGSALFDALKDFASYGFNKSHAACYALVAVETAYLKKYHTADFYKYSLEADKDNKSSYIEYLKEMPVFGLNLKLPDLSISKDNIVVKDNDIYIGYSEIKGLGNVCADCFSEQLKLGKSNSIAGLIANNPDIKDKTLLAFAKLGLFEYGIKLNGYKPLTGKNELQIEWVKKCAPLYRKILAKEKEKNLLFIEKDNSQSEEVEKEIITNVEKIQKDLDNLKKQFFDASCEIDKLNIVTPIDLIKNRSYEIDLLGIPFSYEDDLKTLCNYRNKNSFDDLSDKDIPVPCIILSISDEIKTTKSGTRYREMMLMDRNQNIIVRRLKEEINPLTNELLSPPATPIYTFELNNKEYFPISQIRKHSNYYTNPNVKTNIVKSDITIEIPSTEEIGVPEIC